jgi:hypothetical protein
MDGGRMLTCVLAGACVWDSGCNLGLTASTRKITQPGPERCAARCSYPGHQEPEFLERGDKDQDADGGTTLR